MPGHDLAQPEQETKKRSIEDAVEAEMVKKQKNEDDDDASKDRKEAPEKDQLSDLDKYWSAVNQDNNNFTAWTYLLQYVDQGNDVEAAREAYNKFLERFPYCYGYWRKFADYERYKGANCDEVFSRGLAAIPLSVDLWIHYLTYVKSTSGTDPSPSNDAKGEAAEAEMQALHESFVRLQYERAIESCGLEFRSDKLWDSYIGWEAEGKRLANVVRIYDRLLATPTIGYNGHFTNFTELVNGCATPEELVSPSELATEQQTGDENASKMDTDGVDESKRVKEDILDTDNGESEKKAKKVIREKIIAKRRAVYEENQKAVTARWTYEEAIKRPYFHVKPLERCQLKNWRDYLEFEMGEGDQKRICVLFERCLIACAMYDEFWLKFIRYYENLEQSPEIEGMMRNVFERACTIHHPDKPSLHLMWATFEECHSDADRAAAILTEFDKKSPNLLQVAYHRINLERRRENYDRCEELYKDYLEKAIKMAKGETVAANLAIKYARFVHKIRDDVDRALVILEEAHARDRSNVRIALQTIDLALQRKNVCVDEIVAVLDKFMAQENLDAEQLVLFAQRKLEFLEDFGKTPPKEAQKQLQAAQAKAKESRAKNANSTGPTGDSAKNNIKNQQAAAISQQYPVANAVPPTGYPASYYATPAAQTYSDMNYSTWNQQQYAGYSSSYPGYNPVNNSNSGSYNYY